MLLSGGRRVLCSKIGVRIKSSVATRNPAEQIIPGVRLRVFTREGKGFGKQFAASSIACRPDRCPISIILIGVHFLLSFSRGLKEMLYFVGK